MTIIEQENAVFNIIIMSIMNAKKSSLMFAIEDQKSKHQKSKHHLYKISLMKSRVKTMHHNQTV